MDQLKLNVEIRGHINLDKYKNPEYLINGKLADRKEVSTLRGVMSAFDSLKKQGASIMVFDFKNFKDFNTKDVTAKIKGKLNSYKKEWVNQIIIINNGKAVLFTKKELFEKFEEVYNSIEKTKSHYK